MTDAGTPMTSRQRLVAVLEHRTPDRVPLLEMWIDPAVCEAILPDATRHEVAEHVGMDGVAEPTMIYEDHEVEWVDREKGLFRDKWGALQISHRDAVPVPTEPARLGGPSDLAGYTPPDPSQSPVIEKVRNLKSKYPNGEQAIVVVAESGWAPALFLRGGLENLLVDFVTRPAFVKDIMKIGTEYYSALAPLVMEAGADIMVLGDDYSDKNGPMMSPKHFEELILPCDAQVVAAIKRAGGYCIKHTDGDIRPIMDQLVGTGLDCLGPLEPVPGMDLDKILERYPGKITVMGNISVDVLSRGSEEDVVAATKLALSTVSAIGPHIMSSANTIASSVKPDNFLAMVNTTKEFGSYPIEVEE